MDEIKLRPLDNVAKAKAKGFEWFCAVQEGFAEKFKLKKPTKKELERLWTATTGLKVKSTNTE